MVRIYFFDGKALPPSYHNIRIIRTSERYTWYSMKYEVLRSVHGMNTAEMFRILAPSYHHIAEGRSMVPTYSVQDNQVATLT